MFIKIFKSNLQYIQFMQVEFAIVDSIRIAAEIDLFIVTIFE
jgi:hypothetical protein